MSRRALTTAVALAVASGMLALINVAAPAPAKAAAVGKALPAGSMQAAMVQAARSGVATRVSSLTTEDTVVEATPEGPLHAVMSLEPERFREGGDGDWVDIDTDLVARADGMLKTAATSGAVEVSNGGSKGSVLASFTPADDGSRSNEPSSYELLAPFDLPEPSVSGAVATFEDVIAGVDLVVEAKPKGFSHFFVVKDRAAAQSSEMAELRIPMRLNGLKPKATAGGTAFVDDAGRRVVWAGTPMMWDAAGGEVADRSGEEATEGPAPTDQVAIFDATATVTSSGAEMVLKPDTDLLASSDAALPIVIDPGYSEPDRTGWTAVWSNYPTKSFWQTEHSLGAGYEGWEQNKIVRSYFRFPISSAIKGTRILSAAMNVKQVHAAQCAEHATEVYRTDPIGTATTWNAQPSRGALQDTRYSYVGCGSGSGWVGWNIKYGMQNIADQGVTTGTFMIRGKSETNKYAWKQFDDDNAHLEISFMPYPNTSTILLKADGKSVPCGTSGDPAIVPSTSIQMGAKVSINTSNDKLYGVFGVENLGNGGSAAQVATTGVDSKYESWVSRTVSNGYVYRIRSRARVYLNTAKTSSLESKSASAWCYFRVDTSAPKAPIVKSTSFPECASASDWNTCDRSGTRVDGTGTFSIDADDRDTDVVKYMWWVVGPATGEPTSVTSITTSASAARTFTFTPKKPGLRKIQAKAVDEAGFEGTVKEYVFWVSENDPVANWTFDNEAARGANTGRDSSTGTLTLNGATISALGRADDGLRFTGGNPSTATVTGVGTSQDFSVDAWVRVSSIDASATLVAAKSATGDAFEMGYDASSQKWVAGRRDSGQTRHVTSTALADLGQWTHLAAAYDASAKTLTLYVNGAANGTTTYTVTPEASTGWLLGCGNSVLGAPQCATGMLDQVGLWDMAISAGDVTTRIQLNSADREKTSTAAEWDMTPENAAGVVTDRAFGAELAVSNAGTTYLAGALDGAETVPALTLPGDSSQRVRMSYSPVATSTSFTVGARVRILDSSRPAVIAQQASANTAAWTLGYRPTSDGNMQFYFRMAASDSPTAEIFETRLNAFTVADFNAVTAVYDATNSKVWLYLNGKAIADDDGSAESPKAEADFTTPPWQARGAFSLGNGTIDQNLSGTQAPLSGDITKVKIFAGALVADAINNGEDGVNPPSVDPGVVPIETSKKLDVDFAGGVPNERAQGLTARIWGAPTFGTDASLSSDGPIGVMKVDGVDDAISYDIDPWADLTKGFTVECVFRIEATLPVSSERDLCSNKESGGFGIYVNGSELRTSAHIGGAYQVVTTPAEANRWYHVASVWDGTTLLLYVNGVMVGSTAASGTLTPPASAARWFAIGADPSNTGGIQFPAPASSFAHAAIYARGVTPSEASTLAAQWNTAPLSAPAEPSGSPTTG